MLVGGYVLDRRIAAVEGENRALAERARQWEVPAREAARLRQEIAAVSRRGSVLDALLHDRVRPAQLLDALSRHVPRGVHLRSVSRQGDTVTIEGAARHHERVAALVRAFEPLPWLARAELIESRSTSTGVGTGGDPAAAFAFSVRLVYRPVDTAGAAATAATASTASRASTASTESTESTESMESTASMASTAGAGRAVGTAGMGRAGGTGRTGGAPTPTSPPPDGSPHGAG